MRYIILPQTFKTIIPALFSQCTTVIKDSSYLSGINVAELMYTANVVMAHAIDLSQVLMLYGLVFAMYFVLNLVSRCWFAHIRGEWWQRRMWQRDSPFAT